LLLGACFSFAAFLQPQADALAGGSQPESILKILLGEGRKVFASHFFIKADITFHSGYYPSIFDRGQSTRDSRHLTAEEGSAVDEAHERQMNFLGPPRDWIERFGRHFMITEHTHLAGGDEREILPWLKLSAELDPQRIDTYTVAAYWLRVRLGKVAQAEQFLREGLRANPNSYEILFELGRLYSASYKDLARARNVWEKALQLWEKARQRSQQRDLREPEPDPFVKEEIITSLAQLEEQRGNFPKAIEYLAMARDISPNPQALQKQIDELTRKLR
jgi:tetratricopeptide (TPR) repeat protein